MKKKCELCTGKAAMHCESDSASLCWECDEKVHSANFLVERHIRHLLCHVCSLPTSWSASGSRLGRTFSVCHLCLSKKQVVDEEREERDDCVTTDDDDEENEEEDCCSDDDDVEEEEEEQVVPSQMSSTGVCFKRLRDDVDCLSDDDYGSSSSYRNAISYSAKDNGSVCVDSFNPYKRLQTQSDPVCKVQFESTSLETSAKNVEAVISETRNLDHNALAIGSESADSS